MLLIIVKIIICDSVMTKAKAVCLPDSAQCDCKSHGWACTTCLHLGDVIDTQTRLNPVPTLSILMLLPSTNPSSRVSAVNCFSELHSCIPPSYIKPHHKDSIILCLELWLLKRDWIFLLNLKTLLLFSTSEISQGVRGEHLVQLQVNTTWC